MRYEKDYCWEYFLSSNSLQVRGSASSGEAPLLSQACCGQPEEASAGRGARSFCHHEVVSPAEHRSPPGNRKSFRHLSTGHSYRLWL